MTRLQTTLHSNRAVAAYLKVVRRRKSWSADGTRGGLAYIRGGGEVGVSPKKKKNEFLALLCAFLTGFYAFGTIFQSRFFLLEKIFLGA